LGTSNTEQLKQFYLNSLDLRKINVQFLYKMRRLHKIMVVVFIILDWIYVLMNTATMIPCRRLIGRIGHLCRLNVFALLGLRIDPESKTTTVKTVESHVYLESLNHRLKIIELCFASHTSTIV